MSFMRCILGAVLKKNTRHWRKKKGPSHWVRSHNIKMEMSFDEQWRCCAAAAFLGTYLVAGGLWINLVYELDGSPGGAMIAVPPTQPHRCRELVEVGLGG